MIARISNLRDQIGLSCPREVARCPKCGEQYSANKGDYFMLADTDVLKCANGHRKTACHLVVPVHTFKVWEGADENS